MSNFQTIKMLLIYNSVYKYKALIGARRLLQILSFHHSINVYIEEPYCVYCADWAGEDNKEHGWSQFSAQIRWDKGNLRAAAGNRVQIDADREMNGRFRVSN